MFKLYSIGTGHCGKLVGSQNKHDFKSCFTGVPTPFVLFARGNKDVQMPTQTGHQLTFGVQSRCLDTCVYVENVGAADCKMFHRIDKSSPPSMIGECHFKTEFDVTYLTYTINGCSGEIKLPLGIGDKIQLINSSATVDELILKSYLDGVIGPSWLTSIKRYSKEQYSLQTVSTATYIQMAVDICLLGLVRSRTFVTPAMAATKMSQLTRESFFAAVSENEKYFRPCLYAMQSETDETDPRRIFIKAVTQLNRDQANGLAGHIGPVRKFNLLDKLKNLTTQHVKILAKENMVGFYSNYDTYIAIGDIHGDFLAFLGALYLSGFIDENANYKPQSPRSDKKRLVVQLGDVVDRKRRSGSNANNGSPREELNIMEFVEELHAHAMKLQGEGIVLLCGNHDFESLTHNWTDYMTTSSRYPLSNNKTRREVFQQLPGFWPYLATRRPPLLITRHGWVFAHGDAEPACQINPVKGSKGHRALRVVLAAVADWVDLSYKALHQTDIEKGAGNKGNPLYSIMWNRTMSARDGDMVCGVLKIQLVKHLGLKSVRVVLGHSPQTELTTKCGDRIFLADVMLSEAFIDFKKNMKHRVQILICDGETQTSTIKSWPT